MVFWGVRFWARERAVEISVGGDGGGGGSDGAGVRVPVGGVAAGMPITVCLRMRFCEEP